MDGANEPALDAGANLQARDELPLCTAANAQPHSLYNGETEFIGARADMINLLLRHGADARHPAFAAAAECRPTYRREIRRGLTLPLRGRRPASRAAPLMSNVRHLSTNTFHGRQYSGELRQMDHRPTGRFHVFDFEGAPSFRRIVERISCSCLTAFVCVKGRAINLCPNACSGTRKFASPAS